MSRTSRREFLKIIAVSSLPLRRGRPSGPRSASEAGESFLRQIGVCTPLANNEILAAGGCAYIEEGVWSFLIPEEPEEKFQTKLADLKKSKLPILACNGFLPGAMKAVGPEAKHAAILAYAETTLARAARAGVGTVVWGSGDSRRIPEGFGRARAEQQFSDLAKKVASLAGRFGVTIVLEPLNGGETNFINCLEEGAAVVEAVDHPNFQLLADFYHMLKAGETPGAIEAHGKHLRHCHIAEKEKRTPPGVAGDDFKPFLRALKRVRYQGRLSIECRWNQLAAELPPAVAFLKKQIADVAAG